MAPSTIDSTSTDTMTELVSKPSARSVAISRARVETAVYIVRIAPNGSIRDADDYRRQFPDGRIGSDASQATPEKGKRIVVAATKALIADYQTFLRAN